MTVHHFPETAAVPKREHGATSPHIPVMANTLLLLTDGFTKAEKVDEMKSFLSFLRMRSTNLS